MSKLKCILLVAAVIGLSGCAFGRKVDYSALNAEVNISTQKSVTVAVTDNRPYVLSGKKENTFVGVTRGGFYNPFDMNTVSRKPLAVDIQQSVLGALAKSQIKATADDNAADQQAASADQRLLVLKIREWKSDTYGRTRFDYDLNASVIDESGKVLGSKDAKGTGAIQNFQDAGKSALTQVLASPEIADALKH